MVEPIRRIKNTVRKTQTAQKDVCIRKIPHFQVLFKFKKITSEPTHRKGLCRPIQIQSMKFPNFTTLKNFIT